MMALAVTAAPSAGAQERREVPGFAVFGEGAPGAQGEIDAFIADFKSAWSSQDAARPRRPAHGRHGMDQCLCPHVPWPRRAGDLPARPALPGIQSGGVGGRDAEHAHDLDPLHRHRCRSGPHVYGRPSRRLAQCRGKTPAGHISTSSSPTRRTAGASRTRPSWTRARPRTPGRHVCGPAYCRSVACR